ncbi:MAG TPA: ribonuclease HII [Burkholderiales bacterium]|nr:ribonuclease HII [Burkholderiales bacterium]
MSGELVCGVDEAGRGPLAGPVYAAAVILAPYSVFKGLTDSKRVPVERRLTLAVEIKTQAVAWAVASASVEEIDELNILRASLLAMKRAVEALTVRPNEVLVDGIHFPKLEVPARAIVRGDSSVAAISAASILAKVDRDRLMMELHLRYPQYGFDHHKGYPTPEHFEALKRHGPCAVHRRSFAPVRELLP